MTLRTATIADIPACASVHLQTWQIAYRGIISDDYLDALTLDNFRARWERGMGNITRTSLVAEVEAGVVGFVVFGLPMEKENVLESTGEVYALYIHPNHARRGIGSALMEAALQSLTDAGYTQVILWTWEINHSACRFYEGCGFMRDGTEIISESYGAPLNEVRYSRTLPA